MDEVCDSPDRPTFEVKSKLNRAIVLPLEGKGDRSAVDEVCDSKTRPTQAVSPILGCVLVLPLEGKGDRSAVDEVNCSLAPLRGASKNAPDN